jgi:hypothetical protein
MPPRGPRRAKGPQAQQTDKDELSGLRLGRCKTLHTESALWATKENIAVKVGRSPRTNGVLVPNIFWRCWKGSSANCGD